jgi:hypothetical protein
MGKGATDDMTKWPQLVSSAKLRLQRFVDQRVKYSVIGRRYRTTQIRLARSPGICLRKHFGLVQ